MRVWREARELSLLPVMGIVFGEGGGGGAGTVYRSRAPGRPDD